jgi:predicted transcriptional regulator
LVATLAAGLALLAVALYRRLSAEATSNQAQRARILECVLARPGSSVTELARATGLHPTTVRYHLRLLQEFHAVALRRDGRTLRVFQNGGTFPPEEQGKRAAAMRSGAQRILASLPAEGAPAPALARAVGVSRQAIHKQLPALAAAGLLRLERRGSAVWAFPMLQGRDKRGLDDGLRLSGLSSNVRHAPSSPIEK